VLAEPGPTSSMAQAAPGNRGRLRHLRRLSRDYHERAESLKKPLHSVILPDSLIWPAIPVYGE